MKPFILPIHQVFVFIKFRNMFQRQQNSEKFRLHKRLFYDKGPAKTYLVIFDIFGIAPILK